MTKDYRVSSIDAFQSPITFLYQQFSKVERSKRLVAELENNDKRRELLQELFVKYVDYDIIQLESEEFKDFAGNSVIRVMCCLSNGLNMVYYVR